MKRYELQNRFLNRIRQESAQVTLITTNGYQLRGRVLSFDTYTLILDAEGRQQLIYKHAVSTIIPESYLNMADGEGECSN